MDLRALKYYVTAVEEGSISAAAERLFIAQPSISTAISKLETELDTQLLVRSKQGVSPTNDGQNLYRQALDLLGHAQAITRSFVKNDAVNLITLEVSGSISFSYLKWLLTAIRDYDPVASFRIQRQNAEAAMRLIPASQVNDDDIFIVIGSEHYQLLLPSHHPLAYATSVGIDDLQGARLIARTHCERHQEMQQFLQKHKVSVDVVAEVDNEEWAVLLVEQGIGIAIMPLPEGWDASKGVVCRSLNGLTGDIPVVRQIGIAIRFPQYTETYYQELVSRIRVLAKSRAYPAINEGELIS